MAEGFAFAPFNLVTLRRSYSAIPLTSNSISPLFSSLLPPFLLPPLLSPLSFLSPFLVTLTHIFREALARVSGAMTKKILEPSDVARAVVYALGEPPHVGINEVPRFLISQCVD